MRMLCLFIPLLLFFILLSCKNHSSLNSLPIQESSPSQPTLEKIYDQTAALFDVNNKGAKATAYRNLPKAGETFRHRVIMVNPPSLRKDEFFEGWLMQQDSSVFISTGRFLKTDSGYELAFTSPIDYSTHVKVVITLEKNEDKKPEKPILEGSF